MQENLDERMKMYEDIESKRILIPKLPICIRLDGRGFSKYTKDMTRPFDKNFTDSMIETMKFLMKIMIEFSIIMVKFVLPKVE